MAAHRLQAETHAGALQPHDVARQAAVVAAAIEFFDRPPRARGEERSQVAEAGSEFASGPVPGRAAGINRRVNRSLKAGSVAGVHDATQLGQFRRPQLDLCRLEVARDLLWPPHIWLGVSIENQRWTTRLGPLAEAPAAVKFLSCEPPLPG